MRTVPLSDLKTHLADEIRRIEAGEEIVITRHGRPVARILPLDFDRDEFRRRDLVRRGVLRPADDRRSWTAIRGELLALSGVADPTGQALAALAEDRAER